VARSSSTLSKACIDFLGEALIRNQAGLGLPPFISTILMSFFPVNTAKVMGEYGMKLIGTT